MKTNLLAVLAIASSSLAYSQVDRIPMIEHFTQASCPPCASQNPVLQQTLTTWENGGNEYVKVAHQTSWPGTDPMYSAFPAGPDARVTYYGVSGVPNTSLNGAATDAPNTAVTAATLATASQIQTAYDITVTQSWQDANTVDVTVAIENVTGSAVSDADRLYITMYEAEVDYTGAAPGTNGEEVFYNVMREMYNDQGVGGATNGSALGTIAANSTETISFTISNLPAYLADKSQIRFAAYVQNNSSKEVFQANKSTYSPIPGIVAVEASSASTAGSGYCDYSFSPAIEFTNNDSQTAITEVVAEYSINGGAAVQETVSGLNLLNGQSTTINFPATQLAPGSSTVSYTIVSANGSQPWSSPQAVSIPDEVYSRLSATGVAGPVSEGLENGALISGEPFTRDFATGFFDAPGTDVARFAIYDGPAANIGAIGGYAGSDRSILVQFYALNTGSPAMNLIMDKVNLGTGSVLTFDYGYRQYTSENDNMTIYASSDCGATWNQIFSESGATLATGPAVGNNTQFIPASASDWVTEQIDMSAYDNTDDVVVRFEFTSAFGNNLWLDNIYLGETNAIQENEQIAVSIFPNPTKDNFTVKLDEASNVSVKVVDVNGKVVASQNVAGQAETTVDASALASGIYTVLISTDNGVATKKVVVE